MSSVTLTLESEKQDQVVVAVVGDSIDVEKNKNASKALSEVAVSDPYLVTLDSLSSRDDPRRWSTLRRWLLYINLAGLGLSTNLSIIMCIPATAQIQTDLQATDASSLTLIVSIWNLGATMGCLVIGPLSEVYGRAPVYHICNLCALALLIGQTQAANIVQFLILRFLNGAVIASTSLNPAIIADVFPVEQRGRAQSIISLFLVLGPMLGPTIGGWVSQTKGWRWTFWVAFFISAFFSLTMLLQYRETYEVELLRRRARKLRKESDPRYHSEHDESRSVARILLRAIIRPIKCFAIPVYSITVLVGTVLTAYCYILATTLPLAFQREYGFSEGQSGLAFLGVGIGMSIGAFFCNYVLDRYTLYMKRKMGGEIKPEWRLPPLMLALLMAPIGLVWYGWSAQYHTHFIVPIIGSGIVGCASYIALIPVRTYLADAWGVYRASALAGLAMFTNLISALLPLVGPPLYSRLDMGWGNTVLGFAVMALIPAILAVFKYGEQWRIKSRITERLK